MEMRYYPSQWGKRYHFDNVYSPLLELSMVQLYQAGEIIAGDGFEIPNHVQTCSEISYIVSGKCDIYTDDRVFHAKEGDIHVTAPGMCHRIVAEKDENFRMAYIGFHIRPDAGQGELAAFYTAAPNVLKSNLHQLRGAFEQLLTEIYISRAYSLEVVDACITQILISVWRSFCLKETQNVQRISDEIRMERIVGHTVFRVLRYIDANLSQIENVGQVSRELKYNATYLSKVFREKMGFTMTEYIADKKIETAKKLLREGVSVGDTAQRMGYASSQSFSKMFRRYVGCTPSEYVRRKKDTV